MNNGKGSIILLTIIAVCTLLVAVVGATFAYFSVTMTNGESGTTIEVTSGTLSIEYDGDSKMNASNLNPGDVVTKNITVSGNVTGSTNLYYLTDLEIKNNTYRDGALVYTITSTNTSNNGTTITSTTEPIAIPSGTSTLKLGEGSFAGPTTGSLSHDYVVTISLVNTGEDQSADLNQTFEANFKLSDKK